jgi:polysaccharide biosynthesis protein PelA
VRKSLRNARNYACYYGEGALETLERFEVVILQPKKYARADLERLRAAKVITLAYISIGEESLDQIGPHEDIESFAWAKRDVHGVLQRNSDWGSVIVNPEHPLWRARVLERAKSARTQGFSGFFLDVLDAENSADRRALAKLIRDIRVSAPAAPIMINRGFKVLEAVQDAVDAVMFESLSCTWRLLAGGVEHYELVSSATLNANLEIVRGINAIAERWEIGRFALDYTDSPALEAHARATAESLGFVSFTSNRLLTRL